MGTVAGFVGVVIMMIIGKIKLKAGARWTCGILLIIQGIAYIAIYLNAKSIVLYAIAFIIMVSCSLGSSYICIGPVQALWFPKKRGVVVGISTIGANVGSAILVPLMTGLTTWFGWKAGLSVFGVLSIVLGILGIVIIRDNPLDAGFYPDNVSKEVYEAEYKNVIEDNYISDWTISRLLKTKETYLAIIVPAVMGLALIGIISQFVTRNIAMGLTPAQAIGAMTAAAIFGMIGSYVFGLIDTKFGTKTGVIVYLLFFAAGVVMNILGAVSTVFVYISIVIVGASLGGTTNFSISWPASIFGPKDYPTVNNLIYPVTYCIMSLSFAVNALVYTITDSLTVAYIIYAALLVLGAIIAYFTDSTKWNKEVHPELDNRK